MSVSSISGSAASSFVRQQQALAQATTPQQTGTQQTGTQQTGTQQTGTQQTGKPHHHRQSSDTAGPAQQVHTAPSASPAAGTTASLRTVA